jgi:hypothetical protein
MRTRSPITHPVRLTALAAAIVALSACNLQIGTGVEAREDWDRTYTVTAGATLEIREANGKISIEAVDGDQIQVHATRVAKAPTDEAARAALKDFSIAETATADRVELDSGLRGVQTPTRVSLRTDYVVKVPRALNVTLKATNGDVDIAGVNGALNVDTVNGRVNGTGLAGSADVSAMNGQLKLEFAALGDAGIRCKTVNGQIVVTIPKSAHATLAPAS